MNSKMAFGSIIRVKVIAIGKASLYSESTTAPSTVNMVVDRIHGDHAVASRYAACRAYACLRDDAQGEVQDSNILYINTGIKCSCLLL